MFLRLVGSRCLPRHIPRWYQPSNMIDVCRARCITMTAACQRQRSREEMRRHRKEVTEESVRPKIKQNFVKHWKNNEKYAEYTAATEPGEKKDTTLALPLFYSPRYCEAAWYDWWIKKGFFRPDYNQTANKNIDKTFVMVLSPPNVTGTLHLGHALGNSIQDAIVRWHRMNGYDVLWNPGRDHAGIATQVRVEKQLWAEQRKTRHDLGREKFVQQVWNWKEENGFKVYEQTQKLGSALDWSRETFTMDPKMCRAVNEAFIRLFDEGLIYRSKRMVNWSCALKSAISDLEIEHLQFRGRTNLTVPGHHHKVTYGVLTSFAYPVVGQDTEIVVSTTRPETMLGDTAIAVHPDDTRYHSLHGSHVQHPFCDRTLPIVCDEHVRQDFATGAVHVSPAHNFLDYEIALRHKLPMLDILDDEGTLINVPKPFEGMSRLQARVTVVNALREKGLHREDKDHPMTIPMCSRSRDVIEPRLKDQWYVDCKDMGQKAIQAVEGGRLEIIPENHVTEWRSWLDNEHDWCISRQLWWGHQVPAYRVTRQNSDEPPTWICAHSKDEAVQKACHLFKCLKGDVDVTQDDDVLDTWFSSALFPFAVFGWPDKTPDLTKFYPTTMLDTTRDMMFFWVARMVMIGEKLTGQLPFNKVLFHSILCDGQGRKMSKSAGNVIDPVDFIHGTSLEVLRQKMENEPFDKQEKTNALEELQQDFPFGIKACGSDALRYSLLRRKYMNNFTKIPALCMEQDHDLCKKIYEVFHSIKWKLGDTFIPTEYDKLEPNLSATDKWMLSRVAELVEICDQSFKEHELYNATFALRDYYKIYLYFTYFKYVKEVFDKQSDGNRRSVVQNVLLICLDTGVRALSPFMPFLSEELYQRLPRIPSLKRPESVCIAPYPKPEQYPWRDTTLEEEMFVVKRYGNMTSLFREDFNLRFNKQSADVFLKIGDKAREDSIANHIDYYKSVARTDSVTFLSASDPHPADCCGTEIDNGDELFINLQGIIDLNQQQDRLAREKIKYATQVADMQHTLETEDVSERETLYRKDKLTFVTQKLKRTERAQDAVAKLSCTSVAV